MQQKEWLWHSCVLGTFTFNHHTSTLWDIISSLKRKERLLSIYRVCCLLHHFGNTLLIWSSWLHFLLLPLWLLCCHFCSSFKCSPGFNPCSFYSLILCALPLMISSSDVIFIARDSPMCLQPWQPSGSLLSTWAYWIPPPRCPSSTSNTRCLKIHLVFSFQICSSSFMLCPGSWLHHLCNQPSQKSGSTPGIVFHSHLLYPSL